MDELSLFQQVHVASLKIYRVDIIRWGMDYHKDWMNNIFIQSLLNESAIWKINDGSLE